MQKLEASVAVMTEQEQSQMKLVEDQEKEVAKFGSSTVDVEMMRADIKNIELLLTQHCHRTREAASGDSSGVARYALEQG